MPRSGPHGPIGPNKDFEKSKHVDENGIEFWKARELLPLFGYKTWQAFEEVIKRAARAAQKSGQTVEDHFRQLTKMVETGSRAVRQIKDWKLDRYACYLIAQNGDSNIPEIAIAQTYFAVQTRRQELFDILPHAEKRVFIRNEVTKENKKLFSTAKRAGVSDFGSFNDAGYRGLYGIPLQTIELRKGIKKGELLDRAGASELAANLFRITQTDEKLKRERVQGRGAAERTHMMVGSKVRQTIKQIGGELPENLPAQTHIRVLKRELKKQNAKQQAEQQEKNDYDGKGITN